MGPIARMLLEHQVTKEMVWPPKWSNPKKYLQSGNTDALVAADIKSYIDHVALHLARENYRLFVMADMVLQGRGEEIINSDLARSKGLELKELGRTRAHYEKLVGNVESDLPS